MAIRVTLECGHASMLRVRTTPQGYTHDWEVFVRGVDNADISQYVDKVVFHLHETFPKPKRILKEPPYIVKESGYAGFVIPIDVYLRNKDEPKRIQISYDLVLQPSGPAYNNVIRHNEVFTNLSEEFRKKLLKGGGVGVSGGSEEPGDKGDYKMVPPMVSKPKLSGSDGSRKHRTTDLRTSNSFADLFGNPMTLPAKVSPETKRVQPPSEKLSSGATATAAKVSPVDKTEKSDKAKSKHSPHKDKRKERSGEERKDKRDKTVPKEKDRIKEKPKRPGSPSKEEPSKRPTPASLPSTATTTTTGTITTTATTTTPGSPSKKTANQESPKSKERDHKKIHGDRDKPKDAFKVPIEDRKFDRKKKKHKDERSKDRSKDQEKPKETSKKTEKKLSKPDKPEKTFVPPAKEDRKSPKHHQKDRSDKIRGEKITEDSKHPKEARSGDRDKQRHKHKRKDRKDRSEESSLDKDTKKSTSEKKPFGASSPSNNLAAERDSDSAHSLDEEIAPKSFTKSDAPDPVEVKTSPSRVTLEPKVEEERTKRDARNAKISRAEERDSRKRKRKLVEGAGHDEQHSLKRSKERSASPSVEPVSSSQSPISSDLDSRFNYKETPVQPPAPPAPQTPIANETTAQPETEQVAPDSTNNALVEPDNDPGRSVFSDDYVTQLKELQQKIMTLQDNQELQRVVQVIAETGQYEITKKTFDFDLCALDRRTVLRLQQFFSTS